VEDPSGPLGPEDLGTHLGSLEEAPQLHADFQAKRDGRIEVLINP